MNPFDFVALVFQPARRADWKVGAAIFRFMGSFALQNLDANRDQEPADEARTPRPRGFRRAGRHGDEGVRVPKAKFIGRRGRLLPRAAHILLPLFIIDDLAGEEFPAFEVPL